jgi:5'(3')-deoxyribonucleotidase
MKTILLDMDGVIADFHQGVCDLYGVNLKASQLPLPWEYAVEKNIEDLLGMRVSSDMMWDMINAATEAKGFWLNLRPYPWMQKLLNLLTTIDCEIVVSSSPGLHPLAHSQKVEWLYKHTNIRKGNVMLGKHKHLMAKKNTFLIDDCDGNISKFTGHGGHAFLWPQNWNQRAYMADNHKMTFEMLEDHLTIFLSQ